MARIRSAFDELCTQNEEFRTAVEKGTNGESAIRNRISLARSAVDTALKGSRVASTRGTTKKRSSNKK